MTKLSPAQKRVFRFFKAMRKQTVIKELHSYGGGLRHAINIYKQLTTGDGYEGDYPGICINAHGKEMKKLGMTFNKTTLYALRDAGLIKTHLKVDSHIPYQTKTWKTYYYQSWYVTMTSKGLKVLESIE